MFFILCHPASIEPLTEFALILEKKGYPVYLKKMGDAEELARICSVAECVIADVGHQHTRALFRALATLNPKVRRIIYYDNREKFVPGEYSKYVEELLNDPIARPHRIVFANSNLVDEFDLPEIEKVGLGYFNMKQVEAIRNARPCRKELFDWLGREDRGELILTYFGGANQVYFNHAFPRFQKILKEMQDEKIIILFHPHPRSNQGAVEGMILSPFSFEKAAAIADIGLYYQTSATPVLLMAGLPLIQVGHEPFNERCVIEGLIPVCHNAEALKFAIQQLKPIDLIKLQSIIGYDPSWQDELEISFK